VWACMLIFVWLWGKICAGEWCCEVVGSCEVQLSCEVRCSTSWQPDKNLCMYMCVCVARWWVKETCLVMPVLLMTTLLTTHVPVHLIYLSRTWTLRITFAHHSRIWSNSCVLNHTISMFCLHSTHCNVHSFITSCEYKITTELGRIMQSNSHCIIHGHQFWYQ